MTLLLTNRDIEGLVSRVGIDRMMGHIIKTVEKSFIMYKRGKIKCPVRSGFYFPNGLVEFMPAQFGDSDCCIKIVGFSPNNYSKKLPSVVGTLAYIDGKTSETKALADASLVTAMRTGAASAVATKYLAKSDIGTLGFIGCGAQGITQLHALLNIVEPDKIMAYDRVGKRARQFSDFVKNKFGITCEVSPASEVNACDIITTTTPTRNAEPPVVMEKLVEKGAHINAVGADDPGKREVETRLLKKAKVFPDFVDQAKKAGECQVLMDYEIAAELGDVIVGRHEGRKSDEDITIFDSTGTAFEDLMVFREIIQMAKKRGVGKETELAPNMKYPFNPYENIV